MQDLPADENKKNDDVFSRDILPSRNKASGDFLEYALLQTVFVNVGFLYTGQIFHKLSAGLLVFITVKCPAP